MAERDDELLKRKSEKIDAVGKVYLAAKKARCLPPDNARKKRA